MDLKCRPGDSGPDNENLPFTDFGRFELGAGHYYIRRDNELELGKETLYQFSSGVLLRVLDLVSRTDQPVAAADPGKRLTFAFKLAGTNTVEMEDGECYRLHEGTQLLSYCDNPQIVNDTCAQGDDYLLVLLMLDPAILLRPPFDLPTSELPEIIQASLRGTSSTGEVFAMTPELIQALRELLKGDRPDAVNRAYLEAKTTELLCLAIRSVLEQDRQQTAKLSDREQRQMQKARKILQESWQNPPSLEELGQTLGVGKSRLKQCFKWMYGESIGAYVARIRMQHAQQLLSDSTLNVSQVAWEIGYEHSCNFVTAFKRQFGITPKAFQKIMIER